MIEPEGGMIESVFPAQIDSARHDALHLWSFLGRRTNPRALYLAAKLVTVGKTLLYGATDDAWSLGASLSPRPSYPSPCGANSIS